jgi:hypothetical protein
VATKKQTIPVTERALIQRINRKLRQDGEVMKVARGAQAESQHGRYYTIDLHRNYLIHDHLDPETVGREIGVLAEYEHMVRDDAGAHHKAKRGRSLRG